MYYMNFIDVFQKCLHENMILTDFSALSSTLGI